MRVDHRQVVANGVRCHALVREVHAQLRAPDAERSFVDWLCGELRPFALGASYAERLRDLLVVTLPSVDRAIG